MGSIPGTTPPPKPWERAGSASGPAPFKPPSPGSTSDIVEASGTAKPGEMVSNTGIAAASASIVARPSPARPWEQNYGNSYAGYGSNMSYNSGYGSGVYGSSSYGGLGGSYGGGGLYGNSMYRGGYGGGLYGGGGTMYGGGGMYGGTMNNCGFGGPMGAYGMAGPYGNQDPNDPYGPPSSPPGFWMSFLRVMHGVVNFFGRISMLIDQNTQAFHMFMTALLQLFDRSGMLYGELARFALRLLGNQNKAGGAAAPGTRSARGHGRTGAATYRGAKSFRPSMGHGLGNQLINIHPTAAVDYPGSAVNTKCAIAGDQQNINSPIAGGSRTFFCYSGWSRPRVKKLHLMRPLLAGYGLSRQEKGYASAIGRAIRENGGTRYAGRMCKNPAVGIRRRNSGGFRRRCNRTVVDGEEKILHAGVDGEEDAGGVSKHVFGEEDLAMQQPRPGKKTVVASEKRRLTLGIKGSGRWLFGAVGGCGQGGWRLDSAANRGGRRLEKEKENYRKLIGHFIKQ
ncbi:Peroxisomal membrane protein 13 [Platanthera guangdongensis]|uniref:Peroxin-13 n=1 Tax=Platanthera guangdongensis TaxID=2320717 RepID=A0ABR2MY50_9ASPA